MSDNRAVFEFFSKSLVPCIVSEHRTYYACGNSRMQDFLRDFKVNSEMDILVLGLGDVRHVMATVAGLSQRPPSSAGEVKEIRFHLNDDDKDVIARDIILLEIMNKLDPESKSDVEFLWSVWYNAFIIENDFTRLKAVLEDLIDKYSNSSRDSERICKFGDKQSLKYVLKTWNCWLNRKLNQSSVKQSRLQSFKNIGYTMSFDDCNIAKYASMQVFTDRGIKESDVETVGKEMLTAARDGFVNFSEDHKGQKDFVNPTLMRPGCDEWLVEEGAHAAASYLPLQKEFLEKYSTVHEACFEKMRETISLYLESWNVTKVTYTFWATDLFHLCHWLLPSDMTFDFIFTSNLMDHVGLLNLLVTTQPRLKNSRSVLLTESHTWNRIHRTLDEFFRRELRLEYLLLPSMVGLRLAENLDLGSSNLKGFYRTMHRQLTDNELIYWTKSFNQENVQIDLEENTEIKRMFTCIVATTFLNKLHTNTATSARQTPLAAMYCFQRVQHLVKGGMAALLEHVEALMNDRKLGITCNRITWDVVCWASGLKHQKDRLCMVEIPFKDLNSRCATLGIFPKFSCRLRLDYKTSSNEDYEILSLFQYNTASQHFQVLILESVWKALPEDATVSLIGSSSPLPYQLRDLKVQVKKEGKVAEPYNQPQQIDAATTKSTQESGGRNAVQVEPYEIKDAHDNCIQAILYKQKSFNVGRTALPYRLIDDSELLPFTCGHDIKAYLEETMICDLMFCSPNDIESRAKAFNGQNLLTDDAFMALRLVIEQLWYQGSQKDKILIQKITLGAFQANEASTPRDILILEIKGYYMYEGLPFIRLSFATVDKNRAGAEMPSCETGGKEGETVINVKDCELLELVKKMLYANSLRMSQERSTVQEMNALNGSLNSFLQMVFPRDAGDEMKFALQNYPSSTEPVNKYIDKSYSASIRQNYVYTFKEATIRKREMNKKIDDSETQLQPDKKSSSVMPEKSSMDKKQALSWSECKKSTQKLKNCTRCRSVVYCSKECQVKDWPSHQKNCSSATAKVETVFSTNSKKDDRFVTEPTSEADPQSEGATVLMSRCNSCGVLGT